MKKIIALMLLVFAGVAISQAPGFIQYWPAVYDLAENLAVKRAVDAHGNPTDRMFFRLGWGPCLVVDIDEWQTLVDASPSSGYMNMRDYADSVFQFLPEADHELEDCIRAPLELRPSWRGSRPVFYRSYDETLGRWIRASKSPYRILAPNPSETVCEPYNSYRPNSTQSNYWQLPAEAVVYRGDETYLVGDLNIEFGLTAVCRDQDISVFDYE